MKEEINLFLFRIVLKNFNPTKKKCVSILKKLYKDYLQFDPIWHFFWEGEVTYLRVSAFGHIPTLLEMLKNQKIEHEMDKELWLDNIPITKEYQDAFAHIFHGFSTIAMDISIKRWITPQDCIDKILKVMERIQHCFANNVAHVNYTLGDMTSRIYGEFGGKIHEPYLLLLSLLRSSFWQGHNKAFEKRKK